MAVWSKVLLSQVENRLRIEAEFYRPNYLDVERVLTKIPFKKLRFLAYKITDGTHFTPTYTKKGIRFYSAINVKEGYFQHEDNFKFISDIEHSTIYKRCPVEAGDVLLRKVGVGPRWACVVPDGLDEFSIFVSVALIKCKGKINPYFLATFINSKYGQSQLLRLNKGISQPDLHLEDISELKVPHFDASSQDEIAGLVKKGLQNREKALNLYAQAQQLLEQELGLDKLEFEDPIGYEASFSEVTLSNRLDTQHYLPKYNILLKQLKKHDWSYLRDIRIYNRRGVQPVYVEDGELHVVNSQHIGREHLDYENLQRTTKALFASSPEAHIKPNDLLIYTTGAYIGSTNVYLSTKPALASNHVNILRLKDGVDAAYMSLVMQSVVGKFQTEKHSRGSAQAELYPTDIDKFVVPLLAPKKQNAIGDLVRGSLSELQDSYQLLEKAKCRVEELIEEAVEK